ncbi:hypothetical protein M2281_005261 [Mesorhizobium soli]|uniref:hypothetical protein n=1 Tax=Pseudaminobacter soli (ex Li et al. 2025) TaxID=1295366 RepID=UPI002473889A|nr:hypothetical protein [Mesorhizobium soli]MDH6234641.1 hypothetical protein [Mesorhizobium soli]
MRYIAMNILIELLASTILIQNVHAQDTEPQVEVKAEDAKKPQAGNNDVFELGKITVHGGEGGEGGTSGLAVS